MRVRLPYPVLLLVLLWMAPPALAQRSERFGPYELHYSVVNTTFLQPDIAAAYGITRGRDRAILNLSLQEHLPGGGTAARAMQLKGRTWDLLQKSAPLEFQAVRENPAIYYIAQFRFFNAEWRYFEIHFRADGGAETYTLKIKQQMFPELE